MASTDDRGVLGTSATSHTALGTEPAFVEILLGATTKIEYNKDLGVFNVWTRSTQATYPEQSYGAGTPTLLEYQTSEHAGVGWNQH